jgi:hypothetical protein
VAQEWTNQRAPVADTAEVGLVVEVEGTKLVDIDDTLEVVVITIVIDETDETT